MAAAKAHEKWGGRKKGTPNKLTASAREAIELAFDGLGGVTALTAWAQENPTDFYTRVWPKILPLQISGTTESQFAAQMIGVREILNAKLSRLLLIDGPQEQFGE